MDIGQTIAVKSSAVVAVEAMEGTDQSSRRAGSWPVRRAHRQGREAEPGHAVRRAGRRRRHDRAMQAAGRDRPVGRRRQDADDDGEAIIAAATRPASRLSAGAADGRKTGDDACA
jgi:DUF1009 family protein